MSVFSNVIKPQGLEPLQFPTKFRSHSTRGQLEACQCLSRLFANPPGCPDLRLAFRNVRENFQRCRNCFGKELEDMRRIEFLRLVRRLALHQISAPKARIRVAARARETPKSRSTSRRVSRSRSRVSSCRMASGTARSHRGGAGIGERRVGYNPCGECDLGRCTARMPCSRLVDGRLLVKIRSGGGWAGGGSHKGSYGTAGTDDGPRAGTSGRGARTVGGRRPSPARTRTGPGRDAAARIPAAPAQHDRPWTRPHSPGAAMTGGGPVAARPHLSPVPDHLPGRPTSDPGGPGLRRLYGLFWVGYCRSGNSCAAALLR